ncbi:MAG: T9SS type A sorting domain-containing protein, partial [Bacteroidales bacterium]|nr:T9SS type A sorting domain-containing protein [Bacteroidales bacterium]
DLLDFNMPLNDGSTVQCLSQAVTPTPPAVNDNCGNPILPTGPVYDGSGYNGCEGYVTYTWTYTDCSGNTHPWVYTYMIDLETTTNLPPDEYVIVECLSLTYQPTPPLANDNCGNPIVPTGPVMGGNYNGCQGTVTYTWTYVDCALNSIDWTYTWDVQDNTAPWIIAPPDMTVFVNNGCYATNFDLGLPQKGDNCSNALTVIVDGLVNYPVGSTTVTWWVKDCAGNLSAPDYQIVTVVLCELSGVMSYNETGVLMNNVDLELNPGGYTTTTDASGYYSFPGLCAMDYTLTVTNNNKPAGGVNATDAAMASNYNVMVPQIEIVKWMAGDGLIDGIVDAGDAQKMLGNFVGLWITNPNYIFTPSWAYYWAGEITATNPPTMWPTMDMKVTIGGSNSVKNIYGQCVGDFNGSFSPNNAKAYGENLTLTYGNYNLLQPGASFELPLMAESDMEVGAISLVLNFPADEVSITGAYLSNDPSSPVMYNVEGNELRIGWYSSTPIWLTKGENLVTLQMKLMGETSQDGIKLSLVADPLNELVDGSYQVIENAALVVDIPSTSAMGVFANASSNIEFSNHPNPFNGTTILKYNVPMNGQVVIEIFDLVGTQVTQLVNETQLAGSYTLRMDAGTLKPGVYTAVLKLKNSDSVMTRAIKMISR